MIKSNDLESILRLIAFIFIFSWVMTFALSPCRVFASESMNPDINSASEEIAAFDEDEEATFDTESAANYSPFLYAEHYQSPVYYPERQERMVTSHLWMRIIPFAVLVILAIATMRFFGRRRQKDILTAQSAEGRFND